jgi:hypothetical protein
MKKNIILTGIFILGFCSTINAVIWPVPVSKKIGGAYGDYRGATTWGFHTGIDIEAPQGTDVRAVSGGKIDYVQDGQLRIEIGTGIYYCFAHVQNIVVSAGQIVSEGQKIAEVGLFDGYNHLHFNPEDDYENPNIDNPLNMISVDDTVLPMIEGIWFRSQNDKTKYFETLVPTVPDAILVWDEIDIVAKASDVVADAASYRPGIYKIGYQIPQTPYGVTPITDTQWLVEFTGALPLKAKLNDVYSEDPKLKSDQYGNFYYVVSNTNKDDNIYWNTKQKLGGALSEDAEVNLESEARYMDGLYKVKIDVQDIKGNSDNTDNSVKKAIVDNFRPFVRRVTIGDKYQAEWTFDGNNLNFDKLIDERLGPGTQIIMVVFSEPMTEVTLSIDTFGSIPLTSSDPAYNQKTFLGKLDIASGDSSHDGFRAMTISAQDLAGNQILQLASDDTQIDPATQLTRDSSGNMQGIGGNDTRHHFKVGEPFTLTVNPPFTEVSKGETVTHTVTIKNNYVPESETFSLSAYGFAPGWSVSGLNARFSLPPGRETSYTFMVANSGGYGDVNISVDALALGERKSQEAYDWSAEPYNPYEHPDETYEISSSNYPTPWKIDTKSKIGILLSGWGNGLGHLLGRWNVETVGVKPDLTIVGEPDRSLSDLDVLLIGTGGLTGLDNSSTFRNKLAGFVNQGGVIISLTSQYGYELNALPESPSGYGWSEDQSCHTNAVYIDASHPIFSGQDSATLDASVDGYLTKWPSETTVLLRRTKNQMPAMVKYGYGQGEVVVLTFQSKTGKGRKLL